jgi:hypothetical protein
MVAACGAYSVAGMYRQLREIVDVDHVDHATGGKSRDGTSRHGRVRACPHMGAPPAGWHLRRGVPISHDRPTGLSYAAGCDDDSDAVMYCADDDGG